MRAGIVVNVTRADRHRLEAIVLDRSAPQKHVWRANIILATADGCGTAEIMRRSGKSKPVVWRWQARFMAEGVEGLTRDKTRTPGKRPLSTDTVQRVVDLALGPPPGEETHWTGRMLAKAAGVSLRSVQRILDAHQLAPHRIRTFKLSTDPKFAEKLKDVVGLYVDPPAHAVVLSVDEKSQIQALDRTQPGLPMKPGRAGTMTHDYKRHGTTTLFAALNILDGTVIGRNMQHHRHQEFIRFLNTIEQQVPVGKVIHAIVDNYATHKHPKVRQWLARHPRWTFHFTATSASWLNAVEGFFAKLTRQRLKRGVFRSVIDLQVAINRFVAETNLNPKPFVWTADPKRVLAAVKRGKQTLKSDPTSSNEAKDCCELPTLSAVSPQVPPYSAAKDRHAPDCATASSATARRSASVRPSFKPRMTLRERRSAKAIAYLRTSPCSHAGATRSDKRALKYYDNNSW